MYIDGPAFLSELIQMFFSYECTIPFITITTFYIVMGWYVFDEAYYLVPIYWSIMLSAYLLGVPLSIPKGSIAYLFVSIFWNRTTEEWGDTIVNFLETYAH
jgi:hypothetical protein